MYEIHVAYFFKFLTEVMTYTYFVVGIPVHIEVSRAPRRHKLINEIILTLKAYALKISRRLIVTNRENIVTVMGTYAP